MNKNYINLENVNLHYASVAYQERSLKALLSRLGDRQKKKG